jgi:ABC-type phosphate/phosphonate transport system permease subunit
MVNATQPQSWSGRLRIPQWRNFLPLLLKSIVIVICLMLLATAVAALSVVSVATCMHPERALEPLKSLADWSTSCHSLSLIQTRTPPPAAKGSKKR